MTEDEAKTKWCPFARVTSLDGSEAAANRYENVDEDNTDGLQPGSFCIGSACMAWRVISKIGSQNRPGGLGYCGLAGKP